MSVCDVGVTGCIGQMAPLRQQSMHGFRHALRMELWSSAKHVDVNSPNLGCGAEGTHIPSVEQYAPYTLVKEYCTTTATGIILLSGVPYFQSPGGTIVKVRRGQAGGAAEP